MRARSEDTPSAPRTETVPVLFGQAARFSRGMKRPDGRHWAGPPHSPLLSVTSSRNPFAVIARSVLADQLIPDGALVLLAILASLHRGKRPLTLSAQELAVSQGVMLSTHYDRRHRLQVLGYLDEDGKLKPEYRPSEAAKAAGGFCRVDLTSVHGLPPQAVRALAALSDRCNRDKRSRARVPTLARASGRSVRAWHRAFVALAVAGWAWSRGRCRGLGRDPFRQGRADSGKRHTPFRRMAHFISSSRERQKESDPAVPGGCDTLIQAQQRTARRPTQDELLAMPRAARVAALEGGSE